MHYYTAYKHMHYYTAYKHMHQDSGLFSPLIVLYFKLHPLAYGSVSLHCKLWLVDIAK